MASGLPADISEPIGTSHSCQMRKHPSVLNVCVALDAEKLINIDWHPRGALGWQFCSEWWKFGAPEESRTPDPRFAVLMVKGAWLA
jgi:hypothetical protein